MRPSNILLFAAAPMLSAAMGFLMVPLMTWTMPNTVIATFGLFQYATAAGLILVTFGLDQAFLRELTTSKVPADLLRKCLLPCAALLAFSAPISFALLPDSLAQGIFGDDARWIVPLLAANIAVLTIHRFGAQQTRMNPRGGSAYLLAELLLRAPLLAILVFFLLHPTSVNSIWLFSAVLAGSTFAAFVFVVKNWATWNRIFVPSATCTGQTFGRLITFGAPLAFAGLLYWAMANLGAYLTQWMHGTTAASRIVVATSLANIAIIGQTAFSLIWLPIVYRKMDEELTAEDLARYAKVTCAGAVSFFAVVVIGLHCIQHLLGSQFRDIAPIATALCVLPMLFAISEVTFIGLMITRKSGSALAATGLGLFASAIANVVLVPAQGAIGASVATAISAFFFFAGRTELACRAWRAIHRGPVYFGALSLTLAGCISPLIPSSWGPVCLLILAPYLLAERRALVELFRVARTGAYSTRASRA